MRVMIEADGGERNGCRRHGPAVLYVGWALQWLTTSLQWQNIYVLMWDIIA